MFHTDTGYDTLVPGITRSFVTSGTDRAYTFRLDRVAYRNQSRKLTVYMAEPSQGDPQAMYGRPDGEPRMTQAQMPRGDGENLQRVQ